MTPIEAIPHFVIGIHGVFTIPKVLYIIVNCDNFQAIIRKLIILFFPKHQQTKYKYLLIKFSRAQII